MRLSIFLDPQEGMTYADIVAVAQATERGGFHGLYRSDHLAPTSGHLERAATEAWTTLAGLARETSRIRLGTLITPLTFHQPTVLSKMVSTVDEMSGGRVDVSIGTGWNVGEHEALGLEFESLATRFERLEEYVQVLIGLWGEDDVHRIRGAIYRAGGILPRPLPSPRPPIIIGGHGRRKTPLLAARYADEYNIDWPSVEQCREFFALLEDACRRGRPRARPISRSVLLGVDGRRGRSWMWREWPRRASASLAGPMPKDGWPPIRGWQAARPVTSSSGCVATRRSGWTTSCWRTRRAPSCARSTRSRGEVLPMLQGAAGWRGMMR